MASMGPRVAACAVVLATGCGRLGFDAVSSPSDGEPADALPAPTTVTVETDQRGVAAAAPQAGVLVWTNLASGELDDVGLTDGSGRASLHLDPGGAVTAAYAPAVSAVRAFAVEVPTSHVRTVLAAQPGDTLVFGDVGPVCDFTPRGTVTVSWAPVGGAVTYAVQTACNGFSTATTIATWNLIASDPDPSDLVIYALDGSGVPIAAAAKLSVGFGDGDQIAIASVDWSVPPAVTAELTGLPAQFQATANLTVQTPLGVVDAGGGLVAIGLGSGTVTVARPSALANPRLTLGVVGMLAGVPAIQIQRVVPAGATVAIEPAGAAFPPVIAAPTWDTGSRTASWSLTNEGAADAYDVLVNRTDTTGNGLQWTVLAPFDAAVTSVQLPIAPAAAPVADPAQGTLIEVLGVQTDHATGWADVRQRPEWTSPRISVFEHATATAVVFAMANGSTP